MGNSITYEFEDGEDESSDVSSLSGDAEELTMALGSMLAHIERHEEPEVPPVIRRKPDLRVFRVSNEMETHVSKFVLYFYYFV